jgi:hypothetical protein
MFLQLIVAHGSLTYITHGFYFQKNAMFVQKHILVLLKAHILVLVTTYASSVHKIYKF